MAKKKIITAKELLYLILLSSLLGGLFGSVITFHLLSPEFTQIQPINKSNESNVVIERIYYNENVTLEDRIIELLEKTKTSVVYINTVRTAQTLFGTVKSESSGSGFIVSDDGYIVTNHHVIADASNITVVLYNGDEFPAVLKGADPLNDVAVIKITPSSPLKPLKMGDSDSVKEGKFVVAIGSPFRLKNTITFGIISATNRKLETESGFIIENVIQTDAAINPGNSGGPLIDLEGNVIGINTAIISTSGGSEGIGFAIPINTVKKIYNEIIETGRVRRPWLGVMTTNVNKEMVNTWNLGVDYGVLIIDFADYSPAREAGLHETISSPGKPDFVLGDIIISIGGQKITNNSDLLNTLLKYKPGDKVEVGVYRNGDKLYFNVTLGERPENV
jgi:S1-C subfamily serine protease